MINFEVILDRVGHFGRYQIVLCSMIYWLGIPISCHIFSPVFFASNMDFRCEFPSIDNSSSPMLQEDVLNLTTPYDATSGKFDSCRRFQYNESLCRSTLACVNKTASTLPCDKGYQYDRSVFTQTIISEWDLVCDRRYLPTIETAIFFVGIMVSGPVLGYCADRFGRKPTVVGCAIGNVVFGVIASFAPWFSLFVVARFFVGGCINGEDLIGQVYMMEITSTDKRVFTSIVAQLSVAFGYFVNSFVAFLLRDWRFYHFAISLLPVPFLIFSFFIPESPRWHFSHSRDEIGKEISDRFAKYNGKEITAEIWEDARHQSEDQSTKLKYSFVDLFKPPRMRWITIKSMVIWFVVIQSCLALSLNIESLSGDIFINNVLNGAISFCAVAFVGLVINRTGRPFLLGGSLLVSGISSLANVFITAFAEQSGGEKTAGKVLYFIGFLGSWAAITIAYLFTIELFPTVLRSNGIGISSFCGAVGGILAPIVNSVQQLIPWFPSMFLAIGALVAGIFAVSLPETTGATMPQTINEAEVFYAERSRRLSMPLKFLRNKRLRYDLSSASPSTPQFTTNDAFCEN